MKVRFGLSALCILVALLAASCGSVELPAERFFALTVAPAETLAEAPAEAPTEALAEPVVAVLRVYDLQPAGAVDRDYPMLIAGVEVVRRELDRWIAPLDRLVTDALVLALSRRGVAELVKGAADPGAERWSLHGRVLDFAEVVGAAGNSAHVTLELWLEDNGQLVFRDEFTATEAIGDGGTAAAAAGLSRGLARVADQVAQRLRHEVPEPPVPETPETSPTLPAALGR